MTTLATPTTPAPPAPPRGADLRRRIVAEAIRAYEAARDLRGEAAGLADADPTLASWAELAALIADDAERGLLGSILAAHGGIRPDRMAEALYEAHPPRAVEHDGKLYVAVSLPGLEPGEDQAGDQVVHLAIIEGRSIARDPVAPAVP